MKSPAPISLEFAPTISEPVRSRIEYAFRVFAAVYGHPVVPSDRDGASVCCYYGETPPALGDRRFYIPPLYRQTAHGGGSGLVKHYYAGEDFYLSFGLDASGGRPDWLGEVFLWLSSSYEAGISARDGIGRIPYSETVFGRNGLSPRQPYAAKLLAWLEGALSGKETEQALPKAPSPVTGTEHLVVCSHDIDFYYVDRYSALARQIKNLALAALAHKNWPFFVANLKMMLQLLGGKHTGEYLPALLEAAGAEYDFGSTLFVVARQGHRRDPNYNLEQIVARLPRAEEHRFAVGLHGSYRSVIEEHSLAEEARVLSDRAGRKILGNRQHWLRFSDHRVLFDEIERADLLADSTLGFSEEVGFRNGACFAFPPYNFAKERPYKFLEIPLVMMDGALGPAARASRTTPQQLADEVLAESRRYGWGGVSILWHNPVEPLSVPSEINAVFWNCAERKNEFREKWVSLEEFLTCCAERYRSAGLLLAPLTSVGDRRAEVGSGEVQSEASKK